MKYDTSGISLGNLAAHLTATYEVPISDLRFSPQGEEAFNYIATEARGERFFVRVQPNGLNDRLESNYAAVAAIGSDCGIPALLVPCHTKAGRFTSRLESFTIVMFPFIAGTTAYETTISDADWKQSAEIIAALHGSERCCDVPILARETFDNPFAAPIRSALQRTASATPPRSTYQLRRMRDLGSAARRLAPELVPTHGDPNLANILIAADGSLHLTDWGELAWGPRERDLTSFTEVDSVFAEERFEAFLRRYLELSGPMRLHGALFAFYAYRWVVQEIADYTGRILNGPSDVDEEMHAWQELQPYLPTDHAAIERGLAANMRIVTALADEGFVACDAS
jgi:spectinomycin phosphotransferase